ncbi:chromosome partitioning protein ParA [Eggerthellaceae bacterium zg-893]|nr:chromosome partitioning protein ParA [Eggerthellaceae bacterium zg-893]
MPTKVALCIDPASVRHPEAIGLDGECLEAQPWLEVYTEAASARASLKGRTGIDEVWVVSCDEVAPINLAASIKADGPDRPVCMLVAKDSGSLCSRVRAAGIEEALSPTDFARRYDRRKRAARSWGSASLPAVAPSTSQEDGAGETPVCPAPAPKPDPRTVLKEPKGPAEKNAFLISVVSGSGGSGKSTVAALCACLAQVHGLETLLLDFDLQFGDAASLLGAREPFTVDDVLENPSRLDALKGDSGRPAVLAPPLHIEDAEAVAEQSGAVIDLLSSRFDVIVANTGAAWADQHAVLLERSSKTIFLIDQRPTSLRACRHALDLCARLGIATGPFVFALNRCSKNAPFTPLDVSCVFGGTAVAELKDGGFDVESLLGAGEPLDLIGEGNPLCASVESLLIDLVPGIDAHAASLCEPDKGKSLLFRAMRPKGAKKRRRAEPCR